LALILSRFCNLKYLIPLVLGYFSLKNIHFVRNKDSNYFLIKNSSIENLRKKMQKNANGAKTEVLAPL
jgi:hypothetical protein